MKKLYSITPAVILFALCSITAQTSVAAQPRLLLDKWSVEANVGKAWRTAKKYPSPDPVTRELINQIASGWSWSLVVNSYFANNRIGIGLATYNYMAKGSAYDTYSPYGARHSDDRITFVGPTFALRSINSSNRWHFTSALGIGYIVYVSKHYYDIARIKRSYLTEELLAYIGRSAASFVWRRMSVWD